MESVKPLNEQPSPPHPLEGPLPRYYQVAGFLREQILSGSLQAGGKLPTEEVLAKEYGVSRPTVRKAKELLVYDGLIRSVQGSGCYINDSDRWNARPPTVEKLNDVFRIGRNMAFKIREFKMIANTKDVEEKLKNPDDNYVFQICGVRNYEDKPLSYVIYHFPFEVGSKIPLNRLDENPFIPQLEKLAGIQVVEGVQTISLGFADRIAADHLNLKPKASVLLVESVYFNKEGRPVEYVKSHYREKLPYSIRVCRD